MTKEEKAEQLTQEIIKVCKNLGVEPNETLDVLGLATGNILTTIAPLFGVTPRPPMITRTRYIYVFRREKKAE